MSDFHWIVGNRRQAMIAAAEGLLAIGLAWQLARLIWIFIAPQGPLLAATGATGPTADLGVLTRFDPFFRNASPALISAAAQSFRLYGVRAGGGGSGSAIIGTPDGRQASFAVGDEIAPGVRLQSVEADHVVLARGGSRTPLSFPAEAVDVLQEVVEP